MFQAVSVFHRVSGVLKRKPPSSRSTRTHTSFSDTLNFLQFREPKYILFSLPNYSILSKYLRFKSHCSFWMVKQSPEHQSTVWMRNCPRSSQYTGPEESVSPVCWSLPQLCLFRVHTPQIPKQGSSCLCYPGAHWSRHLRLALQIRGREVASAAM